MLAKGSRDTITTNIVQQAVGLLVFVAVPNLLSVDAYAEVTFVLVLLSFNLAADGGLSLVYSRKMPAIHAAGDHQLAAQWNSSTFWGALSGASLYGIAVAVAYWLKYANAVAVPALLMVPPLAAMVSFHVTRMTALADFAGYKTINIFQSVMRLVTLPLVYWLGLLGWFLSQVISVAAALCRVRFPLIPPKANFDLGLIRRVLPEGLVLVMITLSWGQLLYSGRLFAAMYYPDEIIAQYGLLNAGYQVVASLVISAFLPVTVQTYKLCGGDGKEAAKFVFRILGLSIIPIFILGVLAAELAPSVLSLLFPRYQVDPVILRSLIFSLFGLPILVTLGSLFIGRAKTLHYIAILLLSLGLNWVLVIKLELPFGHRAAGLAQLASIYACALAMLLTALCIFRDIVDHKAQHLFLILGQLSILGTVYYLVRSLWA